MVNPSDWDEAPAVEPAQAQGVELNDDHWLVIRLMRDYTAEHQICADARHAMKQLEQGYPGCGRQRMFELFSYGYVAQACRMAGMRRPRTWSTG